LAETYLDWVVDGHNAQNKKGAANSRALPTSQ